MDHVRGARIEASPMERARFRTSEHPSLQKHLDITNRHSLPTNPRQPNRNHGEHTVCNLVELLLTPPRSRRDLPSKSTDVPALILMNFC